MDPSSASSGATLAAASAIPPLEPRLVPVLLPDSLGVTWFAPDPEDPVRAVAAIHVEWNEHALHVLEATEDGWSVGERIAGVETAEPADIAFPAAPTIPPDAADRAARFDARGALLFSSRRAGGAGDWDLWTVERDGTGWSAPVPLPFPVNTADRDYHGSIGRGGAVYFISTRAGSIGEGDIFRAEPTAAGFRVERLPDGINTELWEVDVLVHPDEEYIVFARTDDPNGIGGDDLFISFRTGSGWTDAQLLPAPVNSGAYEYGAQVSVDGATLFFTSTRSGVERIYEVPMADVLRVLPGR